MTVIALTHISISVWFCVGPVRFPGLQLLLEVTAVGPPSPPQARHLPSIRRALSQLCLLF